jgi:hypothetical protein
MADYITVERQREMGLRPQSRPNYVTPYNRDEITSTEHGVIDSALSAAGTVMTGHQPSHLAKSDDTALTNAFASLFYSLAYSVAGAMITAALLILIFSFFGGDKGTYVLLFFLAWGCCLLAALAYNRWQGLWFSPAGLDHHEIDSRERIAMHAIDKHIELIEQRWKLKG